MSEVTEKNRAGLEVASAAVRQSFAQWKAAEASNLVAKLNEEAKLTALDQSAHTQAIASQIPALRASLAEAADDAGREFLRWADGLTDEEILTMGGSLPPTYRSVLPEILRPWSDLMMGAGYDPGSKSQQWNEKTKLMERRWHFYNPTTGYARNMFFTSVSVDEYDRAVRLRNGAKAALQSSEAEDDRRAAAELWGE